MRTYIRIKDASSISTCARQLRIWPRLISRQALTTTYLSAHTYESTYGGSVGSLNTNAAAKCANQRCQPGEGALLAWGGGSIHGEGGGEVPVLTHIVAELGDE